MTAPRLRVLLVEDNAADARLIQESLAERSDEPFDLETVDTLETGLTRLSAGGIDAMLLDLGLPDSYGIETFVRAKARALGVAIIILTGLNDDSLALKLVQGGAQDFVAKVDVSGNNLTRAILYAVEREKLEQEFRKLNLQLEQRVKDRTAELEASNRELEAFSYSVSHDLRAPLSVLIGFAELLTLKNEAQLDEIGQKYLRRIHESAFRMSELMNDLIRLAKVSRQGPTRQKVPLRSLVDEVVAELESHNEKRKIEWRIGVLPVVECDHGLMKQVLANLISNAVKYTRPREIAVIEIGEAMMGGERTFFVRDNGVGFDMKNANKLFVPFQRLHRDEEFEGTGIGLATVQRIVEKHKGRVWVESKVGVGSTFFFTLNTESRSAARGSIRDAVLA
jgi:two-component system, sensor histidine kinase and response regulator